MVVIRINTSFRSNSYYNRGYADGIANISNANISYTYHQHEGTASVIGGCYGQCVTSCSGRNIIKGKTKLDDYPTYKYTYVCSQCGSSGQFNSHLERSIGDSYTTCGNAVNTIGLICGKTEESIESATIVF